MGQALYRNYRPRKFADVIGQDHITKTLQNAIKSGRISHAYLFTGPRGVGKTSVARILAYEVNSLPYNDESLHLDIIEIDAASNRRIDEIRDLRDKVRIVPTSAKYKVYIIDEVHMLTREAFNALLKTLEEPPAHCIFILATTEAGKLPETIISRTQRFEFKPVSTAQAAEHLADIAKREKLAIDKPSLELLARFGGGSFRDSIGYLDQLSSYGKAISEPEVREMLGLPDDSEIESLLSALSTGNLSSVLLKLKDIQAKGVSAQATAAAVSDKLRLEIGQGRSADWQISLLRGLLDVSGGSHAQELLEIVMMEAANTVDKPETITSTPKDPKPDSQPAKAVTIPPKVQTTKPDSIAAAAPIKQNKVEFSLADWEDIVEHCKSQAASIYTALRLAEPRVVDGNLVLAFEFPLHQKKLEQAKNKELVARIIKEVCGQDVSIESIVEKRTTTNHQEKAPAVNLAPSSVISGIFSGAEVMEA